MGNSELVLVHESQRLSQSQLVVCYTHLQFVHMLCLSYTRECNWWNHFASSGFFMFIVSDEVSCSWSASEWVSTVVYYVMLCHVLHGCTHPWYVCINTQCFVHFCSAADRGGGNNGGSLPWTPKQCWTRSNTHLLAVSDQKVQRTGP